MITRNPSYTITFNNGKDDITIPEKTINENSTSLILFGRNTEKWAKYLNTNFLHILENFCDEYYPQFGDKILEGQLWFDKYNNNLKLCTSNIPKDWPIISNAESTAITSILTSDNKVNLLKSYILLDGNTSPMTGALLLNEISSVSDSQLLANKQYVDNAVCMCNNSLDISKDGKYVPLIGPSTVLTTVYLPTYFNDLSYCASKDYIDNISSLNIVSSFYNDNIPTTIKNSNECVYSISSGNDKSMYVTGNVIFPKGQNNIVVSWDPEYTGKYYCTLSGGMHNVTNANASTDIIDDITFEKTSASSITIKRATVTNDEVVYFSIYGLMGQIDPGFIAPTSTTSTTEAPTTSTTTTEAPTTTTLAPTSTTIAPTTTTLAPTTTSTTVAPTSTTTVAPTSTTTSTTAAPTTTTTVAGQTTTTAAPTSTTTEAPTTTTTVAQTTTTTLAPTTTSTTLAPTTTTTTLDPSIYGYYYGDITTNGQSYHLYVNKDQLVTTWPHVGTGNHSIYDNALITDFLKNSTNKSQYLKTLNTTSTMKDWVLPTFEQLQILRNSTYPPTYGSPFTPLSTTSIYWSQSPYDASQSIGMTSSIPTSIKCLNFSTNAATTGMITDSPGSYFTARAIRAVPFTP